MTRWVTRSLVPLTFVWVLLAFFAPPSGPWFDIAMLGFDLWVLGIVWVLVAWTVSKGERAREQNEQAVHSSSPP
jgi:hypothetical protein